MADHNTPIVLDTQPRLSRFSIHGLLTLPRRLCAPPPTTRVGKVRSFASTPILDVTLEDVLARKHLPPLSLKDFEEWLLFMEGSATGLYFILWLRDYSTRYERWIERVRVKESRAYLKSRTVKNGPNGYRAAWSNTPPTSPTLALFFARALDTFFSPSSPHALSLPPELASYCQFLHALGRSAHPDPATLSAIRLHVEDELRASLSRCVRTNLLTNVGSYRAWCGITGGSAIILLGTVPVLVVNFAKGHSRWKRLAIVPGLWLGLTVLFASLCGICLMIYVFGDLRQLRHFELMRPPAPEVCEKERAHEVESSTIQAIFAPPKAHVRFPHRPSPASVLRSNSPAPSIYISSQMGHPSLSPPPERVRTRNSFISETDTRRSIPVYSDRDSDTDSCLDYGYAGARHTQNSASNYSESQDDHGISISANMPAPETLAEDDPAVVSAALALLAHSKTEGFNPAISISPALNPDQNVGNELFYAPIKPPTSVILASTDYRTKSVEPPATLVAPSSPPRTEKKMELRTASFIPAYDDRNSMIGEDTEPLELGPFDFDALPLHPPPEPPFFRPRPMVPSEFNRDRYVGLKHGYDEVERGVDVEKGLEYPSELEDTLSQHSQQDVTDAKVLDPPPKRSFLHIPLPFSPQPFLRHLHILLPFRPRHPLPSPKNTSTHSNSKSQIRQPNVPAFGPTTRIYSPLVSRAHRDVVVRSAFQSVCVCLVVCAVVVACPVPK